MKPIKLGSFVPPPVMADIALFMDVEDAVNLSMVSPHAYTTLSRYRALARKVLNMKVWRNKICSDGRTLRLDDNVELANKQILRFLRTVSEVAKTVCWDVHHIDDKIISELLKITFKKKTIFKFAHVTASSGKFKIFLARNPNKVTLHYVFVHPSLITNETLLLLGPHSRLQPRNNNDQISTTITDDLLKNLKMKENPVSIPGFFNSRLTFSAIDKLFEDELLGEFDDPNVGVIGYQEMPAVLQYSQGIAYFSPITTLCHINNGAYVEFNNMFDGRNHAPTFGISIERTSTGIAENVVIPEDMVHRETFEKFKELVKHLKSDSPIESVVQNRISFEDITIDFYENIYPNYLEIHGNILLPRILRWNWNALNYCSSIAGLRFHALPKLKMTDRLFSGLLEHAAHVTVEHMWEMDLQSLSDENLARLSENRTAGLFQNLNRGQIYTGYTWP